MSISATWAVMLPVSIFFFYISALVIIGGTRGGTHRWNLEIRERSETLLGNSNYRKTAHCVFCCYVQDRRLLKGWLWSTLL